MSRSPRLATIPVAATALLAGMLTVTTVTTSGTASAAPAAAPAAAPETAGTASGFLFYVIPDPQPTCLVPLGLNATEDPSIDRAACAFTEFQVTGATGAVSADLYAGDAGEPFARDLAAAEDTAAPGTYQVSLEPDATWPTGPVRMVVKDGSGSIGEFPFLHNALRATVETGPATEPGEPFDVTGTVTVHSARETFAGAGLPPASEVPAEVTVEVTGPQGGVLHSEQVTAGDDGTYTVTVPAAKTADVTADAADGYRKTLGVRVVDASWTDESATGTGAWAAETAGSGAHVITVPADNLLVKNSFVSSVGWVKPGARYPSRIIITNPTSASLTPTVTLDAPTGSTFESASGPGSNDVSAGDTTATWRPETIAAGGTATLVLQSRARTTEALETIVWRDLSSTAVVTTPGKATLTAVSHGPKVIPPRETYDTARYGDRPFPVVPVQYTDRAYQASHSGDSLESVINDPANPGSTFNLFQEMSLGQLFPDGTVPSAGIGSRGFAYEPGFDFSNRAVPGNTCQGYTYEDLPGGATANPLYTERITRGVYNLPGDTGYYGSDSNGSAVVGSVGGVGALQAIDSGCGETGKLVHDAAALADPEIDYSDYDTDKDGVVDFFMVVFAGCGGNGASQLGPAGCEYPGAPYDNVWPHSSSLEYGYSDPATGLPGFVTDDQLKDLEGRPLYWTDDSYTEKTADPASGLKVFVRVGPYNVNPETAIDFASVISHEYGHSLGLPDFYSTGGRETYGDWSLMATDKSHHIDAYGRQELGWVVPRVLDDDRTVQGMKDSKEDIGVIHWKTRDGVPYTLESGRDGTVHNSEMWVAKLPGRQLLDPTAFEPSDTSEGASASHLWWSGSGNDFGCTPNAGRNFDLSVPELENAPEGSTVTLSFKSRWDIEWDYDYGFVMTTTDGGATYVAQEGPYTTENLSDPTEGNPNQNQCQAQYDHGITGSSGSYQAGTEAVDRKAGNTPAPVFLTDEYDISELVGAADGALRFSYATDPGLARPGWFIDDLTITVDPPGDGQPFDVLVTDFETSGGPDDDRVFNGGCREDLSTAQQCTLGWRYLKAGAESEQDHAYYMEMRDRSGFDLDGNGQADRGAPAFQPGFYLSYTDEAHGYGNAGTDSPPAQSPLDSVPQPGNETPNLNDAAFKAAAGRSTYSDSSAAPHVDNYLDPSSDSGNWEFGYDCLDFDVTQMSGDAAGPDVANGDLTGNVAFRMGAGCGAFDYGYTDPDPDAVNTAPTARATATPTTAPVGTVISLDANGTSDAETPTGLDYSWDFGNGGTTKDATGATASHAFNRPGTFDVTVTVTDPMGLTDTATVRVTITRPGQPTPTDPSPTPTPTPGPGGSSGAGSGGDQVTVVVTSTAPAALARKLPCQGRSVGHLGSWRVLQGRAPGGSYCDNRGKRAGRDVLRVGFEGDSIDLVFGRARAGGKAVLFVDGERVGTVSFSGRRTRPRLDRHAVVSGLGTGRPHKLRLVVKRGTAYVEGFRVAR